MRARWLVLAALAMLAAGCTAAGTRAPMGSSGSGGAMSSSGGSGAGSGGSGGY